MYNYVIYIAEVSVEVTTSVAETQSHTNESILATPVMRGHFCHTEVHFRIIYSAAIMISVSVHAPLP